MPRLTRTVALPVPRSDLLRALALCGPLALLLVADKALKLSWLNGTLPTDLDRGIWTILWHSLLQPAFDSALGLLALAVLSVGTLLVLLAGRRARARVGLGLGTLLVYLAMTMVPFCMEKHTHCGPPRCRKP